MAAINYHGNWSVGTLEIKIHYLMAHYGPFSWSSRLSYRLIQVGRDLVEGQGLQWLQWIRRRKLCRLTVNLLLQYNLFLKEQLYGLY